MTLTRLDKYRWRLERQGDMRTHGLLLSDPELLQGVMEDGALKQLQGVACLPGIVGPAMAMPDAHQGYGFPIGGVAGFDPAGGVVSPGGVGYDINCGVRLLRSKLAADELDQARLAVLADALLAAVPAGVGRGGDLRLKPGDLSQVLRRGAAWAVGRGMGGPADLEFCESGGALPGADPDAVSDKALARGRDQAGTLGAGNHFVEIARVDQVYDQEAAGAFGLWQGQLVVWIHSGSRGLGHQVCDDYLRLLARSADAVHSADKQLIAAPPGSPSGRAYLAAMAAAANFAFNNRQVLCDLVRRTMERVLGLGPAALGLGLVYDVAHNVAKLERHTVDGQPRELWVHRKGATRALGPEHPEVPGRYAGVGQPVLLPGDMGRASYVLKGSATAQAETLASCAHGAGRRLSRKAAKKAGAGRRIDHELRDQGVLVRSTSRALLAEEMPEAYKDVSRVVEILHGSGIAPRVVRTRPLVVIKG